MWSGVHDRYGSGGRCGHCRRAPSSGGRRVCFLIDDEATEFAVNWIEVLLSRDPTAVWRIEQRHKSREGSSTPVPCVRPDLDWALPRRDERTVQFALRATRRARSSRELACEIYPDVFVVERGVVMSRLAGMAAQLVGDIVEPLLDCAQDWFIVRGPEKAVDWVTTVARIRAERRAGPEWEHGQ